MKFLITSSFCFLAFTGIEIFAQPSGYDPGTPYNYLEMMNDPNASFKNIRDAGHQHFENSNPGDEGGSFMDFARWEMFWDARATDDGNGNSFDRAYEMNAFKMNNPICDQNDFYSEWTFIGPDINEEGGTQDLGHVSALAVDPTNFNLVYAGTPSSGIWKTQNFLDPTPSWTNITNFTDFPNVGIQDIAIDPSSTNTIYAATGHGGAYGGNYGVGIIKTTDGGNTWQVIGPTLPEERSIHYKILIDHSNTNRLFTINNQCFYKSEDGGNTWTSNCNIISNLVDCTTEDFMFRDFEQHPVDPSILYISTVYGGNLNEEPDCEGSFFLKSENFGDSWQQIDLNSIGTKSSRIGIAVSPSEPNSVWALWKTFQNDTELFKSEDSGNTWFELNLSGSLGISSYMLEFEVAPNDPERLYAGGLNSYRLEPSEFTGNYLISWLGGHHVDVRSLEIISGGDQVTSQDEIILGCDGGVVYSSENGENWQPKNGIGLGNQQFHGFGVDRTIENRFIGGTQDNNGKLFENGTWYQFGSGDGGAGLMNPNTKTWAYYEQWCCDTYSYWLRATKLNGQGTNWNAQWTWRPSDDGHEDEKPWYSLPMYLDNNDRFYCGFENVYRQDILPTSVNPGWNLVKLSDFKTQFSFPDGESRLHDVDVNESDPNVIWATSGGPTWNQQDYDPFLFKTEVGGGTQIGDWENMVEYLPETVKLWYKIITVETNPNNSDEVWLGMARYGDNGTGPVPYNGSYRVIHSIDGGMTWEDYSDYLPPFPVNDIVFENGTNGGLYAATDVGVFYTNNDIYPIDGWKCFNNFLPRGVIKGLEIQQCTGKIYANVYGQGIWSSPLASLAQVSTTFTESTTIQSNQVYFSDIIIPDGITVTVEQNVELSFGPDAGIIVEQGGYLECDGCLLTNYCDDLWQGIEVWGNSNEHQYAFVNGQSYDFHQGRVKLINGAKIINAWEGVRNWNPVQWGTMGGIIQADKAEFINCRRAAEFMSYQNFSPSNPSNLRGDRSYFYECDFILNDDFLLDLADYTPAARVTMWRTDRIRFEGCNFTNSMTTASQTEQLTKGIYSHDANYIVREHCNDQFPEYGNCDDEVIGEFNGWYRGIEALTTGTARPIYVSNTQFDSNMQSVVITEAENSEITGNTFIQGNHPFDVSEEAPFPNDELNQVGIYSNHTSKFAIYDNIFTGLGTSENSSGVVVFNSYGNDNVVYRNEFTQLFHAASGRQVNRNPSPIKDYVAGQIGLQFKCNTNQNNFYDFKMFSVQDGNSFETNNAGMRTNQGEPFAVEGGAGNTFTSVLNNADYEHWNISVNPIFEFDYNDYSGFNNNLSPNEISPGTMDIEFNTSLNTCPSLKSTGSGKLSGKYLSKLNELGGLEYTYAQLLDEGNTPEMINEVAMSWPEDAWDLRDELISRSPYNSEEVLIAAAKKEIMPHAMLLEVLVANPDALASGAVIRTVSNELVTPMPDYMIDMLYIARDETTLRTQMQGHLDALHSESSTLQTIAVSEQYTDLSEADEPDSLLAFLDGVKTVKNQINLASYLIEKSEHQDALDVLDSLIINAKLESEQVYELNQLKNMFELLRDANTSGRTIANLNSSELAQLEALAQDPQAMSVRIRAANALCFHYGICYNFPGGPKDNSDQREQKEKIEVLAKLNSIIAWPNPAHDYSTVKFRVLKASENTQIRVFDIQGNILISKMLGDRYQGQEILDLRRFPPGTFIIEVLQDNEQIATTKLIHQ